MLTVGAPLLVACNRSTAGAPATTSTTDSAPPATAPATTAPATTPATSPPATAPLTDEQAIEETIHGFWQTWLTANNPPDPVHPGLNRFYTGKAREKATAEIQKNLVMGHGIRLPDRSVFGERVQSVQVDGDRATASTCLVDDAVVFQASTGRVLNDRVTSSHIEVKLSYEDGSWKVAENNYLDESDGSDGCGG